MHYKRSTKNEAQIAKIKNKIERTVVIRVIQSSIPLSFLFANKSDFSPLKACEASSFDFCKTIIAINKQDTISSKISTAFILFPPNR